MHENILILIPCRPQKHCIDQINGMVSNYTITVGFGWLLLREKIQEIRSITVKISQIFCLT